MWHRAGQIGLGNLALTTAQMLHVYYVRLLKPEQYTRICKTAGSNILSVQRNVFVFTLHKYAPVCILRMLALGYEVVKLCNTVLQSLCCSTLSQYTFFTYGHSCSSTDPVFFEKH